MHMITTPIINIRNISKELFILEIFFPEMVFAGQFMMLNIPQNAHILPRPISVFNYNPQTKILSLLIRKRGYGSQILSHCSRGDKISLFGACGNGFSTKNITHKNILLIGGGEGIAPMLLTSEKLKQHNQVTIFAGFRFQEEACVLKYFDQHLSIHYTAQDHTNPKLRTMVTCLLDDIAAPDFIYACGPTPMMKAIHDSIRSKYWTTKLYLSLENRMACGVGACMGCIIEDADKKPQKVCTNGPIFLAEEIFDGNS